MTAEAFKAHDQIYVDRDDKIDREVDVWGVNGSLSVHVWRGWSAVEVGRSFAFAAPTMDLGFGFARSPPSD